MARDKVDLPEGLWEEVEARFGQAAKTKSGVYAAALWYACERYDAEHGQSTTEHADEGDVRIDEDSEE